MASAQQEYDSIVHSLARTSEFFRVALHVHSPESHDFGKTGDSMRNDRTRLGTPEGQREFLEALASNLDLVAITDHMRCTYAASLSKQSSPRGKFAVLPGMEVNFRLAPPLDDLRFHLLAIFPPKSEVDQINRIFAGTNVPPESNRDQRTAEVSGLELPEFVRAINDVGGICILAHLSSNNSLRYTFHQTAKDVLGLLDPTGKIPGERLRQVSEQFKTLLAGLDVRAIEVGKPEDRAHYSVLLNSNGEQRRIPILLTLDAHSVEDLAKSERYTHIKMTGVSFGGLLAAFKMPHTRIRFKDDLPMAPSPQIVGMTLNSLASSGFFEDATIAFAPNLNCVIGPRGSGKSTLIDALRYVFGYNRTLNSLEEDAGLVKAIKGRQQQNLRDTIIRVFYRRKEGDVHVLEATFDPKSEYVTKVFTLDGHPVGVDDVEKCGDYPLRLFGWSEIETLGRNPIHQRQLVDRLIDNIGKRIEEREALRAAAKKNSAELMGLADSLNALFNRENQMVTHFTEYTNDFARLNTPELAVQFSSLDLARRKQRALDAAIESVDNHVQSVASHEPSQLLAEISRKIQTIGEEVAEWWTNEAKASFPCDELIGKAGGAHSQALAAFGSLREAVVAIQTRVAHEIGGIEQVIRQALAADTRAQVEANQRTQAEARLARATAAREAYLSEYRNFETKLAERRQILDQLSAKQLEISGARSTQRASLVERLAKVKTNKFEISVDFRSGGDRSTLLEFLSNKGFLSNLGVQHKLRRWPEILSHSFDPVTLAQKVWAKDSLALAVTREIDGQAKSISEDEAAGIVDKRNPIAAHDGASIELVDKAKLQALLELEAAPWDDLVQITLNGQPVESLSPGQRSSAMLPLIALAESTPLVIDQPEDNLDIRLVGETIADILAYLKERRQVIAATHNSNIVVLGDAEQILVLDPLGNCHGKVLDYGSIDCPPIIDQVLALLEGGKKAFCIRKERYDL